LILIDEMMLLRRPNRVLLSDLSVQLLASIY